MQVLEILAQQKFIKLVVGKHIISESVSEELG